MNGKKVWQTGIILVVLIMVAIWTTQAQAFSENSTSGRLWNVTQSLSDGDYNAYLPMIFKPGTTFIRNGDFENGSDGNWIESSSTGYTLIVQDLSGATPHSGTWAAWLGGARDETSSLRQNALRLSDVRYLHYWYWIYSEEDCGNDFLIIYMNGNVIAAKNLCGTTSTSGWVEEILDLNAFTGKTVTLEFRVTVNSNGKTNLYLDDVSLSQNTLP